MKLVLATPRHDEAAERPASFAARGRFRIVGLVRAVPIRWRILSIAALNSAVVVVLAVLIWNGSKVLGSAWDDVRQVRESDKILALLESETSRLQNLIHRYINQPSPELFAEIRQHIDEALADATVGVSSGSYSSSVKSATGSTSTGGGGISPSSAGRYPNGSPPARNQWHGHFDRHSRRVS